MKPSQVKPGDKLLISPVGVGRATTAFFVRRIPASQGRKAINLVRFPDFAGLDGPDDDGTTEMSDYDLSRRGRLANH